MSTDLEPAERSAAPGAKTGAQPDAKFEKAATRAKNGQPLSLTQVLDIIEGAGKTQEKVSVGDLLRAFGRRSFGPFLLIPALVAVLPVVGALPGVSIGTALLDLVVSVSMMLGQRRLQLPRWTQRLSVPRRPLKHSVRVVRPVARWAGHYVRPRLQGLTKGGTQYLAGVLALFISALMLTGALVPGGSVVPAIAMIVLALGLTAQDGVLVLLAATISAGAAGLVAWLFLK